MLNLTVNGEKAVVLVDAMCLVTAFISDVPANLHDAIVTVASPDNVRYRLSHHDARAIFSSKGMPDFKTP
ncbi:hypothetical protein CBG25_04275 [Arsenophonus sp. ENCA]|nr:hypothetical protein CBG25_04275 [Arsenophonus sp. ENCA]